MIPAQDADADADGPAPDAVSAARRWLQQHGAAAEAEPALASDRPARDRGARAAGIGPADDPDADPEEVARRIVLRKLAAQARTRTELERALKARSVPEEAATAVLDRMDEVGLVDDAAFAQDWVSSRQQRRHLSRSALRRELQAKGVTRDDIDTALAPVGVSEEYEAAVSLARRRQATMVGLPRDVQYRRLAGVLGRRGFGGGVAAQVLAEVLAAETGDDAGAGRGLGPDDGVGP